MTEGDIVQGGQTSWSLLKKLGEGDAGEVYLVESLVGERTALLKRPRKSVFPGDVSRQASQIRTEARILKLLSAWIAGEPDLRVRVPEVLDQSRPIPDFNDRFFIILEKAPGLDLGFLGRACQLGLPDPNGTHASLSPREKAFLASIGAERKIPARVILTILSELLALFQAMHVRRFEGGEEEFFGVIWNDVKPDHLFWDPDRSRLTLIDWGNAQFLDADRTTRDRQSSWADDYRQLFEEMHRYMTLTAPDLPARIAWPERITTENATAEALQLLAARLEGALQEETAALEEARQSEAQLLAEDDPGEGDPLARLEEIHAQIRLQGEMPDYAGALRYAGTAAARLVRDDQLEALGQLCDWAAHLPVEFPETWQLISRLAQIPGRCEGEQRRRFLDALQAALCQDFEGCLWNLLAAIRDYPEPEWWADLCYLIRKGGLPAEANTLRPAVAANRLLLALQAASRQLQDRRGRTGASAGPDQLDRVQSLARQLREEVVLNWTALDPGPPHAALSYEDVDRLLAQAGGILPAEQQALLRALDQPKLQVSQILEAWSRKDFLAASQGLRQLLLWDPDRRRVLRAERAIQCAPAWLDQVHLGPQPGESLPEFIAHLEFEGRELRNQVGPAPWLDLILESFMAMRKGAWPADLLAQKPGALREFPWLAQFERVERVPACPEAGIPEEIVPEAPDPRRLTGVHRGELGPFSELGLFEPLDAWMPEARGSSARVALGFLHGDDGQFRETAVKLMRMDKVDYALPLFHEEVQVLALMGDVPGVAGLYECGFLQLADGSQLPFNASEPAGQPPTGKLIRFGVDAVAQFQEELPARVEDGWVPYLAVEKKEKEDNLLVLCDAGLTRGQFLPVMTLLQMSIQICDILQVAHSRNIVYRDHKILHYYWQAGKNGVYLIDWNVARYHPEGLSEFEVQMDLVQFAARGLHHILTGRTAPGALPLGPTRPEEIEQAARSYRTQWTYDDQRLPEELRGVLEHALSGEFTSAADLRSELKKTYLLLPNTRLRK